MADQLGAEGLNQVNESVQGLNDTLNNTSSSIADSIKDGLTEIKEEILKVAVQSLPKDFLDLAKKVEELTTYTKQMNEIARDNDKTQIQKDAEEKSNKKPGAPAGWTPEKLASKLSEKESAPALTIIQSMNNLFGEKGLFLVALKDLLAGSVLKVDTGEKDKKKGEKDTGGDANLKGPDSKLIGEYSDSIKKLDKLFGNILKVFFKGSKPRFSQDQIKVINDTSIVFKNLNDTFQSVGISAKNVLIAGIIAKPAIAVMPNVHEFVKACGEFVKVFMDQQIDKTQVKDIKEITGNLTDIFSDIIKSEMAAIVAGLLAPIAAIILPAIILFVFSTAILIDIFRYLISPKDAKEAADKASSLNIIFNNIMKAEAFAIVAGILALPAAIMVFPIAIFVIMSSIVIDAFDYIELSSVKEAAKIASELKPVYFNLMFAALYAVAAGALSIAAAILIPFIVLFLLGTALVFLVFDKFFSQARLLNLKIRTGMLAGIFLNLVIAEALAIAGGVLAIPAFIGVILIGVFLLGVFLLGVIAQIALGSIFSLMLVSIMIVITMAMFYISLTFVVKIKDYIAENLTPKDGAPKTGTMLDSILGLVFALLPMAFIMVGFFFIGLLAILCIIPMLGLLLFSLIAVNALPMFKQSLSMLFDTINYATELLGDQAPKDGLMGTIMEAFPELKPIVGLIVFLGKIIMLILVMVAIGVLGLVALAVSLAMVGLKEFAENAQVALPALASALPLIGTVIKAADDAWNAASGADDENSLMGKIGKIPILGGAVKGLAIIGKFGGLLLIIGLLATVGGAASLSKNNIIALGTIGESIGKGIPGLVTGLRGVPSLLNTLKDTDVNERDFAKLETIVRSLSQVGARMRTDAANIEAIRSVSESFKIALEENILRPTMKLDPAIEKINSLKQATAELNAELKKLTSENQSALSTLADIKTGSGGAMMSTSRATTPSSNGGFNPLERSKNENEKSEKLLDYIADDVHGIAQQVIDKKHSWTDNPKPSI
jgi:hypothetical protein